MPLEIRAASAGASLGAALGGIVAVFFGATFFSLALGAVLGSVIGSLIGYWRGLSDQHSGRSVHIDSFLAGSETLTVFTGWTFSITGIILLLTVGWNLNLFFATMFFALGTLYLAYHR